VHVALSSQRYEYATRYSYVNNLDPDDPSCVTLTIEGDGTWSDDEVDARIRYLRFVKRNPGCLVELLRRPVGDVEVIESYGELS
jgi:hypothetical protein